MYSLILCILLLCLLTFVTCIELSFLPQHGLSPLIKPRARASPVYSGSIIQPLDHFDPQNIKKWKMRYYYNGEFFKKADGPLFIMLGGEWSIGTDQMQGGQLYDMAEQNGAYMFYTEHRFYGNSFPTHDLEASSMENVFNTDQALADVINFIHFVKAEAATFKNSKVVVFGGSYSANMAIWLREKYPNDIFAAVASSAPVLAKVEFQEYLEVVQTVLGNECSGIISRAIDQILLLFGTPEGALKVHRDFNTCKPLNTNKPLEVSYFISVISTTFSNLVQYDSCGKVKLVCDALINAPNMDDYTKLATLFRESFNQCITTYTDFIEAARNSTIVPGENGRQWMYQVCFQLGYFQTTASKFQPFGNTISLDTYHSLCEAYFDSHVYNPIVNRQGVDRTNMIYGGLNPKVTRVVSVHGRSDPWHKLGLTKDLNPLAPVIIADGASHVFDLASINPCDNEEMIAAKIAVQVYIKEWLNAA